MTGSRARALKAAAILLALLAPARMAWIVFTVGENNLSNDYVARVPVVVAILEGRYAFSHLFADTWIWGGHSWLALLPFYWFDARFFAWDLRFDLGCGLFLAALKTLLLWAAVADPLSPRARFWLLPVLSCLAFSVSQAASFTFGESALQMQLAQVALAAGCLAVARLGRRPGLRAASLAACGLLASWAWGGGVLAWPVFAVGLFVSGERSFRHWALLAAAAALGLAQYAWFLVLSPLPRVVERPGLRGLVNVPNLLGRPFATGTGTHGGPLATAAVFGAAGLALAAAALWTLRGRGLRNLPALMFLGWALLLALQISLMRDVVTAWYIVPMTAFWLGLAVLLASAPRPLAAVGFLTIGAGFLYSNRTWDDKSYYLASRSPASAACLREWRTAPPGCHDRVFQWGTSGYRPDELAFLGETLERRGLSVFGPRRTYLLQGDAALSRVSVETKDRRAFFTRDGRTPGDPQDFRRLDLALAPGAAVTWKVDVPADTRSATFGTRARSAREDAMLARGVSASVDGGPGTRALVERGGTAPLVLDLAPFAGRTVTLRLVAEGALGGAPLVLDAPRVELRIGP